MIQINLITIPVVSSIIVNKRLLMYQISFKHIFSFEIQIRIVVKLITVYLTNSLIISKTALIGWCLLFTIFLAKISISNCWR